VCLNHGKSSFDLSIKFHANDSREPLNIKKLYKLSVDGGFNSNCEELQSVSLIIRIIVMENDRARLPCIDDPLEDTNMYTASQLCAHGSKSVMFTGQTRKVIDGEALCNSAEEREGLVRTATVAVHHELDICFMSTGHFSIYLLWKDNPSDSTWYSTLKPVGLEVLA